MSNDGNLQVSNFPLLLALILSTSRDLILDFLSVEAFPYVKLKNKLKIFLLKVIII